MIDVKHTSKRQQRAWIFDTTSQFGSRLVIWLGGRDPRPTNCRVVTPHQRWIMRVTQRSSKKINLTWWWQRFTPRKSMWSQIGSSSELSAGKWKKKWPRKEKYVEACRKMYTGRVHNTLCANIISCTVNDMKCETTSQFWTCHPGHTSVPMKEATDTCE